MVERTFGDDVVTYTPGDTDALVAAILGIVDEPEARDARVARALERVRARSWEHESIRYLELVDRLSRPSSSTGPR
jgi:glycosyltransferase involved in cell wall biosynthesis